MQRRYLKNLRKRFRTFNEESVRAWAENNYGDWLKNIQQQDTEPDSPCERFYRYYTQGIGEVVNQHLRSGAEIDSFFQDGPVTTDMMQAAIAEMHMLPCPDDIVTYRYVDPKVWGLMKRDASLIYDLAFLSTTLTRDTVAQRRYACNKHSYLMEIFVPKGTPCAYVELIADMQENELLFPPKTKLRILSKPLLSKRISCIIEN
ncbi:ADP-ribosyltransferase [Agathobaculum sp. NTUH-O15-33]|uniref:ADP-ribosyltransferase n=1 Tax=Agathobaculum sp. NTUH-O15-33 TaxID=3079302 RepID=UPI002958CDB1|nr:ADP-ribosyltransferase [Agathobaculum sp. NTUH-O15-33]WNX85243.1 ADP-ribosyltransferase [Agathobaculum sp. NTUH-O15-33]